MSAGIEAIWHPSGGVIYRAELEHAIYFPEDASRGRNAAIRYYFKGQESPYHTVSGTAEIVLEHLEKWKERVS